MKRVFAHIGFSFALTLTILNFLKIEAAFVILMVTSAAFTISVLIKKTRNSISVPLCMFCSVLACALFIVNYYSIFLPQKNLDNETVNAEFYIVDLEENRYDSYYYTVKTSFIDKENAPQNIKLTIKSDAEINADYYQKMDGEIKLRLLAENGFQSYGDFGNGIFLSGTLVNFDVKDENVFNIHKFILHQRENIENLVQSNIRSPESSIITALLIGDKSEMSSQIKESFNYSGVSHIMAVSGLHLAVFCGAVLFVLKKLRLPKTPQVLITILCVLLYMALAGFSKSILRAGIMMAVFLFGRLCNERSDALNSLGFAVFLICINPYAVTDAGAMLTVTSVLGLIVINPVFSKLYKPKTRMIKYIYEILCASLSVFISTFPVVCVTFGYVSLFGIILNIIMIPLAQITLFASFLMLLCCWFNPLLFILSRICRYLASIIIFIIEKIADVPYAVVDVSENEIFLAVGAVLIIFGIAFLMNSKKVMKCTAIIALSVFIAVVSFSEVLEQNCVYVKEINGYYTTSVVVYNKKNAVVIGLDDSSQYYSVSNMIKSKNLDILLIVDINDSEYSKLLANKFGTLNYVSDNKNIKYLQNCTNFFSDEYFNVDLWQSLNVEYKSNKQNKYIFLEIYDTEFKCIKKYEYISQSNNAIYLNNTSDYDTIYTVNKNGFSERRLNEWQK